MGAGRRCLPFGSCRAFVRPLETKFVDWASRRVWVGFVRHSQNAIFMYFWPHGAVKKKRFRGAGWVAVENRHCRRSPFDGLVDEHPSL